MPNFSFSRILNILFFTFLLLFFADYVHCKHLFDFSPKNSALNEQNKILHKLNLDNFVDPGSDGFCPEFLLKTKQPLYTKSLSHRNQPLHVFLPDERVELKNSSYPWSAIGMIVSSRGVCTGTLVGPNLVLTAAHCVPWLDDGSIDRMKYV